MKNYRKITNDALVTASHAQPMQYIKIYPFNL